MNNFFKINIIIIAFSLLGINCLWADSIPAGYVKYDLSYRFKDGIFLTFQDMKQNKPVLPYQITSKVKLSDVDFYETIFDGKILYFHDKLGVEYQILTSDIWGYSQQGRLYINYGEQTNMIPILGAYTVFMAYVEINDMFDFNSPTLFSPIQSQTSHFETRQLIMDFETGDILAFTLANTEKIIQKDPKLSEEYQKLNRRKRSKKKFEYLRKYNLKHPIFLPK